MQALPGQSSSTPPAGALGNSAPGPAAQGRGLLRVVSNTELDKAEAQRLAAINKGTKTPPPDLGSYIRRQWTVFRNHRNSNQDPLNERLLRAQRMFEGKYDPDKVAAIARFGGSAVYSRLVGVKCRGATALLRDVFLGPERPWAIEPEPDPPVPPEVMANIMKLISIEVQTQQQAGQQVVPEQAHIRMMDLMHAAQQAARRQAIRQAAGVSDKIEDILEQGKFYDALTEFLTDLPLFPFACIKGPTVRMMPTLTWEGGTPVVKSRPRMFWERVSPFDIYWTPGVNRIEDADVIQRKRLTRQDLNDLIGVPGYNEAAIRGALEDYGHGLREWLDAPDTEQAVNEGRENPTTNQSHMIDAIEFHGNIQGSLLLDQPGVTEKMVPDKDRDYSVQSWVVGRYTIKTQFNPSPRQRHPFFITSFEKVPGTVAGHALPDLLEDLQDVANSTLRALVNNMSIASGPQVIVNDDAVAPGENSDELYPWKRWHVQSDPMADRSKPIEFFQPSSNAAELLAVYKQITNMADEISAIPQYITGSERTGGAGRTASGLSMLMGNAQKVLQTVASNVDIDIMQQLLQGLYDMVMLTDATGMLSGQEQIRVRGVNVAVQRETERQKQLQFLQITANPIDAPIIGEMGRARVLRAVAGGLGLPDDVVPDDATLQAKEDAQKQQMAAAAALGIHPPGQPGQPGQPPGKPGQPSQQAGGKPGGAKSPGALASGGQAPAATPAQLSDHAPPVNLQQKGPGGV